MRLPRLINAALGASPFGGSRAPQAKEESNRPKVMPEHRAELADIRLTWELFEPGSHSFCADPSSPQISAILLGNVTGENGSLRNSPQNFRENCAEKYRSLGSRDFPVSPRRRPIPQIANLGRGLRGLGTSDA